jgi:anaerobic selenocysteine-containing dehydrogenase
MAQPDEPSVGARKRSAVGLPGIAHSMQYALEQMGPVRSGRTLLRMNQVDGFDCPSCAWPDPADRKHAEFCENGAKAVAWEATRKRVGPDFFAAHSVSFLREQTDHWLESNGRLTEPMHLAAGEDHYRPISWDDAFGVIAGELSRLPDPNRAVFYTSGPISCWPAGSAPTTCRTARTCATNPAARH